MTVRVDMLVRFTIDLFNSLPAICVEVRTLSISAQTKRTDNNGQPVVVVMLVILPGRMCIGKINQWTSLKRAVADTD